MSDPPTANTLQQPAPRTHRSDRLFGRGLLAIAAVYVGLIGLLIAADLGAVSLADFRDAWRSPEIRFAAGLSLVTATVSAALSVLVATPIGYLMSRGVSGEGWRRRGWLYQLLDGLLDAPVVLPPVVVGLSLLILFRTTPFSWLSDWVVYETPAIVLAQFTVACALAVRTMRATFDQIPDRQEKVAMTLGASRARAFATVLLPRARPGLLSAATVAWARSLGEFGPVLLFAGTTRMRTEVLPTTVYLELQSGNLRGALAVSLMMIGAAVVVLVTTRLLGRSRSMV